MSWFNVFQRQEIAPINKKAVAKTQLVQISRIFATFIKSYSTVDANTGATINRFQAKFRINDLKNAFNQILTESLEANEFILQSCQGGNKYKIISVVIEDNINVKIEAIGAI